jgi:D-inositol-3-phosphate glycosyltransferase
VKIAMVSMNAGPLACLGGVEGGGQSVVVDCLSRALANGGHQVTIFAQRDDASLPGYLMTSAGVRVAHVDTDAPPSPAAASLLAAIDAFRARLAAEWSADPPDVVHAHSWMSGSAAIDAARTLGIPIVQTFHGLGRARRGRSDAAGGDALALRIEHEGALVRAASRIVATSSAEVFALLGMGASPGTIKLIPCGVDLELFCPGPRPVRAADRAFRIATLSRLVEDTGVGDVIDALPYIDGVELHVGGGRCAPHEFTTDPDARALAERAAARGVAQRVTFGGHIRRADVAAFLRASDAVVCAPWHDSIGTVALEAMACAVPVIVSAVGSHVDAVADGISGVHVPARAPRQIAYAIETLRGDRQLCERLGRFGVERTSARYGWPRIAGETFDVYRSVEARSAQLTRSRA